MNAAHIAGLLSSLIALTAIADAPSTPAPGIWVVPSSGACQMAFEIRADDRIVRTTGTLMYTTVAGYTPEGRGWLLHEALEDDNGGRSCRGETAEQVAKHLNGSAYIEFLGDTLYYYFSRQGGSFLEFKRSDGRSLQPDDAARSRVPQG